MPVPNPNPPLPELLTIAELASALKISHRSIWRLVRQQQLPAPIRIGGSIRWRADEITKWISENCPPSETTKECKPDDPRT